MAQLILTTYPREIPAGTFALTLNLRPEELIFLTSPKYGCRYCTEDLNPPGGEPDSIFRLYELLGKPRPTQFTSLALRTPESASSDAQTLRAYGPVTLEIDFHSVAEDLVVFNGDVQDLAYEPSFLYPIDHKVETQEFLSLLKMLRNNKRTGQKP